MGALPGVTRFDMGLGNAVALAAALDRGAPLPRLPHFDLDYTDDLPDCGFWLQLTLARAGAGLSGDV